MTWPAYQKTWTISVNNRITFVSLNDTTARYLFGVKQFLVAHGYTVAGSSNATTAAMDGVDRWATFTDASHRGANATSAQSWIVLVDGSGTQLLLAYWGATDDLAYIECSPGALYTAAGTATFQPTASDAVQMGPQFGTQAQSLCGNSATLDRVWNVWVDSTKTLCRSCVFRNGIQTGYVWGLEACDSDVVEGGTSPIVWSVKTVAWSYPAGSSVLNNTTTVAATRMKSGSVASSVLVINHSFEWYGWTSTAISGLQPPLQGTSGYPILPLGWVCQTIPYRGRVGMLYDTYQGNTSGADGDTYASLAWLGTGGLNGVNKGSGLWPWDGVSTPVTS